MYTPSRGSVSDKMHLFVEYHARIRSEELSVERSKLADEVARKVIAILDQRTVVAPNPVFTHRLTVEQFAICIERCEKHVLMKIRSGFIPKADRNGPPYKIHPRALLLFGVTPEIGSALLASWKQEQVRLSSLSLRPFAA